MCQQQVDVELRQAENHITSAYLGRRQGVLQTLRANLATGDKPSAGAALLEAAALAALSAATGGIGGVVAGAVGAGLAKGAADAIKGVVSAGLSTGIRQGASGLAAAAHQPEMTLDAFINAQTQAVAGQFTAVANVVAQQRPNFYTAPDGVAEARRLKEAHASAEQRAESEQYTASMTEWCRIVDQGERLTDRSARGMDTTAGGILGIDVDIPSPEGAMSITGAHLEGVAGPARAGFKANAGSKTISDLTPGGSGMTVRVIQRGHAPGLFGSSSSARVRVPFESTPSRRNDPLAADASTTGSEGMFIIERMRRRHGNPAFGTVAGREGTYEYGMTRVGAQVIWTLEMANIRIASLPDISG